MATSLQDDGERRLEARDDRRQDRETVGRSFLPGPIKDFVAHYVTHTDRPLIEELRFRVQVRRESEPRIQTLIGAFTLLVFLIWPTDFIFFEDPYVIRVFTGWRIFTFLALGAMYFLVYWMNLVREGTTWILVGYLSAYFAVTGYLFGEIRGLSFPWFYIAYMIPMFSITLSVDLLSRFVAGTLVTISFVAAYMYNVPGALAYPDLHQFVPLTGSAIFLFTMIGHSIYHLDRINFFQSRLVKEQREKVRQLARRDQLTGLYNRREFESRFEEEFERARRYDLNLAVLMLDLDHFKEVNDTYGHQAGDTVLQRVGQVMKSSSRQVDIAGRYGGEEFTMVLPETDEDGGANVAERVKDKVEQLDFETEDGEAFSVTTSIGVAGLRGNERNHEDLIRRADEALYRAKEAGRNRVVRASKN